MGVVGVGNISGGNDIKYSVGIKQKKMGVEERKA